MILKNQTKEMKIDCEKTGKYLATIYVKMVNSRKYGLSMSERDYYLKIHNLCNKGIISTWTLHDEDIPIGKTTIILCPEIAQELFDELRESKAPMKDFYYSKINTTGGLFLR